MGTPRVVAVGPLCALASLKPEKEKATGIVGRFSEMRGAAPR
jgi:hypothetical protein